MPTNWMTEWVCVFVWGINSKLKPPQKNNETKKNNKNNNSYNIEKKTRRFLWKYRDLWSITHTNTTTRKKKAKFINVYGTFAVTEENNPIQKNGSNRKKWTKVGKLLMKWGYMLTLSHSFIRITMPAIVYPSTENTKQSEWLYAHSENRKNIFQVFLFRSLEFSLGKKLQLLVRSCFTAKRYRLAIASVLVSTSFLFLSLWVQTKWVVSIKFIVVSLWLIDYNDDKKSCKLKWIKV